MATKPMKTWTQMQLDGIRLAQQDPNKMKVDQSQLPKGLPGASLQAPQTPTAPVLPAGNPNVVQQQIQRSNLPTPPGFSGGLAIPKIMPGGNMSPGMMPPGGSSNGFGPGNGPGPIMMGKNGGGNFFHPGGSTIRLPLTGVSTPIQTAINNLPGGLGSLATDGGNLTSGKGDAGFPNNGLTGLPPGFSGNLHLNLPGSGPVDPAQQAEDVINQLLGLKPRDTSADVQSIKDLLASTVGQGEADLNARAGAAGFGTSGALAGQTADMQLQQALASQQQINAVNEQARQDLQQQQQLGLTGLFGQENLANQSQAYNNQLALMQALFGGGAPAAPASGGGANDGVNGVINGIFGPNTAQGSTLATSAPSSAPKELTNKSQLPAGAQEATDIESQFPGYFVYRVVKADGSGYDYYKIKAPPPAQLAKG